MYLESSELKAHLILGSQSPGQPWRHAHGLKWQADLLRSQSRFVGCSDSAVLHKRRVLLQISRHGWLKGNLAFQNDHTLLVLRTNYCHQKVPSPSAKLGLKKPQGLCPLWTRHVFHLLLANPLSSGSPAARRVLCPGRPWECCHACATCCGSWAGPELRIRGNTMERPLQSKRWPQCSLIRESRLHFFQENHRRAATVIFFPTDHYLCHRNIFKIL